MPTQRIPAVDQYIAKAEPFAQPLLTYIRNTLHEVVPELEEAMKWSRPFFLYRGVILGNIAAFKQHCSFGLWGTEMAGLLQEGGVPSKDGMGTFGRITSRDDLPPPADLEAYIRRAAELISTGERTRSIQRVAKPAGHAREVDLPEALSEALKGNAAASRHFAQMSPSCRREYADWINQARREETRQKRVATALEWIAGGKARNWKYERPPQAARSTQDSL